MPKWTLLACALLLATVAVAQNGPDSPPQNVPVLKTRPPQDRTNSEPQTPAADSGMPYSAPVNAIPQGTRFLISLQDPLDTRNLEQGQHFTAELSEDLVTQNGRVIPKGHAVRGHVAGFEHGFTGARLMLAMDEVETRRGPVPLIATFMGVPGDPSIKSTGQEGEITQKGPDKKRIITNALIGAGIGAATGAASGGGKGAAVGAVAGAGLGTSTSFLFKGNDLKLDKGAQLEVRLDRDLVVR